MSRTDVLPPKPMMPVVRPVSRRDMLLGTAILGPTVSCAKKPAKLASGETLLRVGYIPISDYLGLYSAMEEGFFSKHGLRVELSVMAGGATIIPALAGGSLDIGVSNHLSNVLAVARGIEVRLVSDSIYEDKIRNSEALVSAKGKSIANVASLAGKRIAVNTRNNIAHIGLMEWLTRKGCDAKAVQFVELPFPQMASALEQGQIDAAVVAEPHLTVSKDQGAEVVAPFFPELRDPMAVSGLVGIEGWLSKNREVALAFHRANTEGIAFALANEAKARAYAAKYTKMAPELAARVRLAALRSEPLPDAVSFWIEMAKKWNLIEASVDFPVSRLLFKHAT